MIISEFYDDFQTFENAKTEEQVILTDTLLNLDVKTADIDKAYLMGYVAPDYVSPLTHLSRIDIVSGAGSDYVEFVDVTDKKNIPWMYTAGADTNGSGTTSNTAKIAFYHANDTDGWVLGGKVSSARKYMKFINSLKISNVSDRVYTMDFISYTVNHTDQTISNYWSNGATTLNFNETLDFQLWLQGEVSKTITLPIRLSGSPTNRDFEVKGTDFVNGEFAVEHSDSIGDYTTYIYVTCIRTDPTRIVWNNNSFGSYPMVSVTYHHSSQSEGIEWLYKEGGAHSLRFPTVTSGDANYIGFAVSNLFNGTWQIEGQSFVNNGKTYLFGGLTGRIPYRWATESAAGSVIKHERTLFRKYTSSNIRAYSFLLTGDMERILQQLIRIRMIGASTTYGFSDNVGVPKYNTDNSPAWQILTGDFEEIEDDLRPWQIDDIKYNPFTIDDVPPYVPPGPTPGGDDNSETGDKIPNQFGRNVGVTSNFITQYLMTQGQISKLGEVLWTSWADDTVTMDMVENFYGKLHDSTGSWNVSSALQFLVSCRMFPVSLATLVGTTATSSIPIGTGAFALQCGTSTEPTFFIANESVAVLNCGEIEVKRAFGDYRDFDNTNITAYLPYCGSVQLSPQDVVGKWIGCTYAIDLFDGSCKAFLYTLSGDDVGYQGAYYNVAIKEGQCGFLIPMSATQAGEVASRRKVDSYVDGSMLFNAGSTMLDGTMRIASGDGLGAIGADVGRLANLGFAYNTMAAQRMGRAGIAAPTIAGGSGFADFMQPASPYIQIRRSHYQMPIQYENSVAYPTNAQKYGNLSQFTGFVQCKNVDVHGFTCHEEERSAIKALLESGVYL